MEKLPEVYCHTRHLTPPIHPHVPSIPPPIGALEARSCAGHHPPIRTINPSFPALEPQSHYHLNTGHMRSPLRVVTLLSAAVLLYSCSRGIFSRSVFQKKEHIYQAPAIGAESRFDEGLRREKHPQQLFSKKERRDMEKMGVISSDGRRDAPTERISPAKADSILYGIKPDTTRLPADSTATPALPDSVHTPQPDSTSRVPQ